MKTTKYKEGDIVLLNRSPFGSFPREWDSNTPVKLGKADRLVFTGCTTKVVPNLLGIHPDWIAGYAPEVPKASPEVHYFKSRSGNFLIKTIGEDKEEIELAPKEVTLQFVSEGLGPKYYVKEGYTTITREEFDEAYKKIVDNLNKFSSL